MMIAPITFDMEVFFDRILELFEDEYNSCLEEINAAKKAQDSTDIPVKLIPPKCFYFGGMDATQIGNTPLFVTYDFANTNEITENVSSAQAETITLTFAVHILDNRLSGNDKAEVKALLRYKRAMVKMINKNYNIFHGIGDLEVRQLQPVVSDIGRGRLRSAGVSITLTMGY